jgi:hypothetical protein
VEERRRQRESRGRRRRVGIAGGVEAEVSQAGLFLQVIEIQKVIARNWDKVARLSQAGLARDLQALLGRNRGNLGQGGTKDPLCHAPASFPKCFGF